MLTRVGLSDDVGVAVAVNCDPESQVTVAGTDRAGLRITVSANVGRVTQRILIDLRGVELCHEDVGILRRGRIGASERGLIEIRRRQVVRVCSPYDVRLR